MKLGGSRHSLKARSNDLYETPACAGCTAIITNPPYRLANQFIRHGLLLVPDLYVLLRLAALEGAGRGDIIDRHLDTVWAGIERLPMMHREGWTGPKVNSGGVAFAWYRFRAEQRRPGVPISLHRVSWRGVGPSALDLRTISRAGEEAPCAEDDQLDLLAALSKGRAVA